MPHIDLTPATRQLASIVAAIPDDQLVAPTPCPKYSVGDLLDHVSGLGSAFAGAAAKTNDGSEAPPAASTSNLGAAWRDDIAANLTMLADAWKDPEAWEGMTQVGGVDLPAEMCALVGLNEVIVHGWDLASATGQAFEPDPALLEALLPMLAQLATPFDAPEATGPFGPTVLVPDDAPVLDRVLGLTGRDPGWAPA